MKYNVIFAGGYYDDLDLVAKQSSSDVLLVDHNGAFYNPQFITLERLINEFDDTRNCYVDDSLVILKTISIEDILKAVPKLYEWNFWKYWPPISEKTLITYFYPKEEWKIFTIEV